MAGNAATPIIPRDGVLVISDATGTPLTLTIAYMNGSIKLSSLNASQKTKQIFLANGTVYAARDVDDQPYSFEFTADAVHFKGDATTATLWEVAMKQGVWSSATSTLPSTAGDVYCLTCTWTIERTNFGGTADNVVALKYVYFDLDFSEGVPSQFSLKGTCIPYSSDHMTIT